MKLASGRRRLAGAAASCLNSGAILPLVILFVWWWGARSSWWSPYLLPGPAQVVKSFLSLAERGVLARHVTASLLRIVKGFGLSAVSALALAFACGASGFLNRQLAVTLDILRHIPPMAMIPLLILWFGIGEASKLAIIVMAAFFPVFLNTLQGIRSCDAGLIEVARSFRYSRPQIMRLVVVPYAIPYILTGMRLGLGYGWRSLIASELVAASSGIGFMIIEAEQLARPDVIMVGVLVIGILGSLTDLAVSFVARVYAPEGSGAVGVV